MNRRHTANKIDTSLEVGQVKTGKWVYVLVINTHSSGTAEDISTVVSRDIGKLTEYVVMEELKEKGYMGKDIDELGVVDALVNDLYWEDPEGVEYSINESTMIV